VHAFTEHPDQWQALKDARVGVDTAVDEVLRWATPAMHFGRVAVRDVALRDQTIRAGDVVTLWNCSANRDEEVFAEPDTYDLGRSPNKHVTFGHGPHFCLGAHLARAEIGALLTALREHVDHIELAAPVRPVYSNFLRGISELPVTMTPAG
jgi:cytochrome P450